jgi:hypothetical protein
LKANPVIIYLVFFIFSGAISKAQSESNLNLIYKLIDKSVHQADSLLSGNKSVVLTTTMPYILEVLKPSIIKAFSNRGYELRTSSTSTEPGINYNLVYAKVEYKDSFTDGLFGGAMLERNVSINGFFTITKSNKLSQPIEFTKTIQDTVSVSAISALENQSLPFTQAPIPSMPLLSNLWEPIAVVGTLIVTVILLFSVRSK